MRFEHKGNVYYLIAGYWFNKIPMTDDWIQVRSPQLNQELNVKYFKKTGRLLQQEDYD